jgi:uncharacterized protein YbcV (DUF1398 family)
MNTDTIVECMKLSFADAPFPQVLQRLVGAGVTSYNADLIKLRNTYYGSGGDAYDEVLPLRDSPEIAPAFDGAAVAASVKAIQRGEIGYAAFLQRIMGAGCSHYEVFIGGGGKVMYFGRDGEFYTEQFPAKAP